MSKLKKNNSKVIYVKLNDKVNVPYTKLNSKIEFINDSFFLKGWKKILKKYPNIVLHPLFTSISVDEINQLIDKAIFLDPTYKPEKLLNYFYIVYKDTPAAIGFLNDLENSGIFDSIEFKQEISLPAIVDPSTELYFSDQGYLNPATPLNPGDPIGIDANAAWNVTNYIGEYIGDGTGVNFIDIEYGWIFDHQDLELIETNTLKYSTNRTFKNHGTSVLSIVASKNNGLGCIGIAPNCNVATIGIDIVPGLGDDYPTSILQATHLFGIGDILLLELQNGFPSGAAIESVRAVRALINTATSNKIVVIEAAGNQRINYDDVNPIYPTLKLSDPAFFDTGAIIVGSIDTTTFTRNNNQSCYGDRVNCFAWNNNVTAATGPTTTDYTNGFAGTSAASAIIAGAAVVVQGIYKSKFGQVLDAYQMRRIFTNPAFVTPSKDPAVDKIGVMPDLNKIINAFINPAKDIYIRDNIFDIGDRHQGAICMSPDIITLNTPISAPNTANNIFGTNSGTERIIGLGDSVLKNQDNYIYVRILNKCNTAIANVNIKIYYSEPVTLMTPNRWIYIGNTTIATVPANTNNGNIELTVSESPIIWHSNDIPSAGHYCYVCIIESVDDPAPPASEIDLANDMSNFTKLIRENNNITWRNFNVIDFQQNIVLPFLLVGDATKKRVFNVYITNTLPDDALIEFEIPNAFIDIFTQMYLKIYKKSKKSFCVRWKKNKLVEFDKLILKKGFEAACKINIKFPQHTDTSKEYLISITQLYDNNIVGKITWLIKKNTFTQF